MFSCADALQQTHQQKEICCLPCTAWNSEVLGLPVQHVTDLSRLSGCGGYSQQSMDAAQQACRKPSHHHWYHNDEPQVIAESDSEPITM